VAFVVLTEHVGWVGVWYDRTDQYMSDLRYNTEKETAYIVLLAYEFDDGYEYEAWST